MSYEREFQSRGAKTEKDYPPRDVRAYYEMDRTDESGRLFAESLLFYF